MKGAWLLHQMVINKEASHIHAGLVWSPLCLRRLLTALPGARSHGRVEAASILSASAFAPACRALQ